VRLDADFESGFIRAGRTTRLDVGRAKSSFDAEARLLYVAMTRARLAVHLPRGIQKRFGLRNTTTEILGKPRLETLSITPAEHQSGLEQTPEAVSPYHSPRAGDSQEMAALKRIFR